MTKEEKAKEIANLCKHCIESDGQPCNGCMECESRGAYYGAKEMAEWKDEQLNEELNLIADWFNHIAQIADDKKTLTGFVMRDSDAFDEIKCLAKRCSEYVNKRILNV